MRSIRGYLDAPLATGATLALPEALTHHLTRVLRLKRGDPVTLFNGDGNDYLARLVSLEKRGAEALVESQEQVHTESPLRLTLAQGLCRGEKMDLVLQKATELGVSHVELLASERSEVRLSGEREERRMGHWRQVIASACEQCGRARLPALTAPVALPTWASSRAGQAELRITLDPGADLRLRDLPIATDVVLAVGPEGGFADSELALLQRNGFVGVRLGPRILRTETAGLAALAALQTLRGDL